jgi:hypothetical protein
MERNYEVQSPINLMLNDEIEIKNSIKKKGIKE